jgi:folate-binding protein YgfZ
MTATAAPTPRDVVSVTGPDAATYLQGQLSQDVAALAIGEAKATFVLAPQGKVDGWGRVLRTAEDAFSIDVDPGAGAIWDARLRRFLLRTKAEIAVTTDVVVDDVAGTEADRIRAGVPRWGAEIDDDTIPATLGQWIIDASVSFTKGCYTGQELVARIDSRGGNVPRVLAGVTVDGAIPAVGDPVVVAGEVIGPLTSVAADPETGGAVGLVFVPRAITIGDEGTDATAGGHEARVVALPMTR